MQRGYAADALSWAGENISSAQCFLSELTCPVGAFPVACTVVGYPRNPRVEDPLRANGDALGWLELPFELAVTTARLKGWGVAQPVSRLP